MVLRMRDRLFADLPGRRDFGMLNSSVIENCGR
jgi:hypothetical protein